MEAEEEKETGAMAVVSRADEDSSGLAAWWWRRRRRRWRGGVYRALVGRGGGVGWEEGEVKKDTKARRKSLNDKRSGQLGLGRQGPKGAAG